jgi:glycosyltransferase involved in cell wall biosynthesis
MTVGLPVVATDVYPGPRELLGDNKYGLLARKDDSLDLADKLEMFIKNNKMRMYYHHQSLIRIKKYSEQAMLDNYRRIINWAVLTYDKN